MTEPTVMRWLSGATGMGDVILDGRVDGHKYGYLAFRWTGPDHDEKWIPNRNRSLEEDWFGGIKLEPHPDADEVWADYCAWRLTQ